LPRSRVRRWTLSSPGSGARGRSRSSLRSRLRSGARSPSWNGLRSGPRSSPRQGVRLWLRSLPESSPRSFPRSGFCYRLRSLSCSLARNGARSSSLSTPRCSPCTRPRNSARSGSCFGPTSSVALFWSSRPRGQLLPESTTGRALLHPAVRQGIGCSAIPVPIALDVPSRGAGEGSALWLNPGSFTALVQPVFSSSEEFGLLCLSHEPQSAVMPPASFAPHLVVTHLPLANGWCNQPP
jgi:hypothetical protein